jgi:hypothetical protein
MYASIHLGLSAARTFCREFTCDIIRFLKQRTTETQLTSLNCCVDGMSRNNSARWLSADIVSLVVLRERARPATAASTLANFFRAQDSDIGCRHSSRIFHR